MTDNGARENRDYSYSSRDSSHVRPDCGNQVSWSDPQATRQTGYQQTQGYSDPYTHSECVYPSPIYEGTHYPATDRGQVEYAVSHSSHYNPYTQNQQQLHQQHYMQPVVTSQVDDRHTYCDLATGSGTGSPQREPATVTQEQDCQKPTPAVYSSAPNSSYAGSFMAEVQKFVVRHSEAFDLLVEGSKGREEEIHHNVHSGDMYEFGQPDALEYHMNIDLRVRQSRFLELVSVGDVVHGHVTDKSARELLVLVTSFIGSHKFRELSDIGVKGIVPFDNLADSADKCSNVFNEMELDDVIHGIVAHQTDSGCLVLSFRGDHIEQLCYDGQLPSGVKVGYIEGRRPVLPRMSAPDDEDYLQQLKEDPGFLNPSSNDNLKLVLGIHSTGSGVPLVPGKKPTLIKNFQKEEFSESDYCHALRKAQRNKWSMETVAVGVKHFKSGEKSLAMTYFNRALEIDATNVEGLVARGALFANDGRYRDGIMDFEKALTLKHTHRNARNYLVQTQVAYGEKLEREGKLEAAVKCYREALADEPNQETAKSRMKIITVALEKQAAERRELERKKIEEKTTLKKLQKLIEKEQRRKNKMSSSKKTNKKREKSLKSKGKKKVSSRTKSKKKDQRRRQSSSGDYTSDESTASASSDTSVTQSRRQQTSRSYPTRSRSRTRSPRSKWREDSRSRNRSESRSRKRTISRSPRSRSRSESRSPRSRKRTPSMPSRWRKGSRSRSRSPSSKRKRGTKSSSESQDPCPPVPTLTQDINTNTEENHDVI